MTPTLKVIAATAVVAAAAVGAGNMLPAGSDVTEIATIAAGSFDYRRSGEYLRDGMAVNAPVVAIAFNRPLAFMKHQVSRAEYGACVAAGACKAVADPATGDAATLPVVGVDWHDATAYASWLSHESGYGYRLPTDAEWAYAAGRRDATNPAVRWIATYENESRAAEPIDPVARPFGGFGVNENGLADIAGNV